MPLTDKIVKKINTGERSNPLFDDGEVVQDEEELGEQIRYNSGICIKLVRKAGRE